mmetsp:Transcript_41769/g.90505  ORF Transcript_41769/g.90505 Transcript_41769/m.90505 type:complete len:733 (+) Transcript_41769:70-2268(+)
MSTNALPYIGRKISLVSNSELRYEGILYTINTQESTIALQSVRCFGTEGRKMPEIPPSSEVYDFIIFRGQDIKDLTVLEGQGKPSSTTDPAIISVNQRPAGKDGKGKGDTGGFMQGKATYGKGASPAPWAAPTPSPAPWGGKSSAPGMSSWNTGATWEKGGKGDWNSPAWAPAKPSPPSGKGWNAGYEKGQATGYGGYGGGGYGRSMSAEEQAERTEMKRRRETAQFFQYQQRLLNIGAPKMDDRHWEMQERRLFGANHVVAGINFSKYDNIEVTTEGGTGREIPIKSFQEACERYELPQELTDNLDRCGYNIPTPVQKYSIPAVLEGSDVMVTAQTGSGKTAAFLVPIITAALQAGPKEVKEGAVAPSCVVLAPTRELCQQITQEAKRLTFRSPARVQAIYGGEDAVGQLRNIAAGIEIVVCAPGRLDDFLSRGVISMEEVKFLVLDEADRMLDMGFEPQIQKILQHVPRSRHTMFFTATWPREVRQLASTILYQPARVMIGNRDELKANQDVTQQVRIVESHGKKAAILQLLHEAGLMTPGAVGKALVFASTKRMCEDLANQLHHSGVSCAAIHGDKDQKARDHALNGLKQGRIRVLVATDVAARGLDIKGIGLVVNYDAANNTEDYVHRIGRTGRAGAKGYAVTFLCPSEDGGKISGIIQVMESTNQYVSDELRSLSRRGGGYRSRYGGGGHGGHRKGGGSSGDCKWCKIGDCWTHQKGSRNRSRSPRR